MFRQSLARFLLGYRKSVQAKTGPMPLCFTPLTEIAYSYSSFNLVKDLYGTGPLRLTF